MEREIEITGGRYEFAENTVLVQKFPSNSLVRTTTIGLGGRYQEHYGGHIIKVDNQYIKEK